MEEPKNNAVMTTPTSWPRSRRKTPSALKKYADPIAKSHNENQTAGRHGAVQDGVNPSACMPASRTNKLNTP